MGAPAVSAWREHAPATRVAASLPVVVTAVLWDPKMPGMEMSEHAWRMYELPQLGAHFWHDVSGLRVVRIEDVDGPTRLHFVHDRVWEEAMSEGLPPDHLVEGGRDETGEWHFQVVDSRGRVFGRSYGAELEPTLRRAVAFALERSAPGPTG